MIYFANPKKENTIFRSDILKAVTKVIDSNQYILGDEVSRFEQEFAQYVGCNHCVGVGTGTDALVLALMALNIGRGDDVIVPSHTAVPTVSAVCQVGATPVFVDIESDYYTVCPEKVKEAITDKTKAIIAVHLYGQACDLDTLGSIANSFDLALIEDCAQAVGTFYKGKHVGAFGDVGCFSFFPTKNLGAIGDGGAISTTREDLAQKINQLRQYGWDKNRNSQMIGMNSRLDELQAAILRVKLKSLNQTIQKRIEIAAYYKKEWEGLESFSLPLVRIGTQHSFHLFVVRVKCRDQVIKQLKENGIHAGIHYEKPVHLMEAYRIYCNEATSLVNTEKAANEVISLPMYPGLSRKELDCVLTALKETQCQNC